MGFHHHKAPAKAKWRDAPPHLCLCRGLRPWTPSPRLFGFQYMTLNRNLIRQFISTVEWATASNICYLLAGKLRKKTYAIVAAELNRMCRTKRRGHPPQEAPPRFLYLLRAGRRVPNARSTISMPNTTYELRDCLGKYFYHLRSGTYGILDASKTFADASAHAQYRKPLF